MNILTLFFELISIPIILLGIGTLIYLIQTTPSTIEKTHHRIQKSGAIGTLLFGMMLFESPQFNVVLFCVITVLLVFHYCYGFSITSTYTRSLVIVPSLVDKHRVQLHLASLSQPLTRKVYNDLFLVLDELRSANVRTVILVSPLFSKKTEPRNTLFFRTQLKKKGVSLESHATSFYTKPWSFSLLAIQKYVLKIPSIQSLPLTHWHQYTLHI
ncbi:hypothetical protein [Aliivibrio salmonicida]|uniref:hypothetical protein n=1 Tax=Aliivibrio salmonicida TaxID=40269 RepID=UPI003D0E25C7